MSKSLATPLFVLFVAVLAVLPASADEGRIPISLPGTVIGANGKYVVTRPLSGGAGPVVRVGAPNVDIDLNGMILTNLGAAFPIISITAGADHVTIRNGTLSSGSVGIEALGPTRKVDIEDVKILGMAVGAGRGIRLGEVQSAAIRRVEITDTSGEGILWDGATVRRLGSIENNILQRTSGGIIVIAPGEGFSLAVLNNRIMVSDTGAAGGFLGYGIVVSGFSGAIVSENTVANARKDGILVTVSRGIKIHNNVVTGSQGNGIHLDPSASSNLVLENVATSNGTALLPIGGSGLLVEGDSNMIEGNQLNTNLGFGLQFCSANTSCNNTFGRNTARNNFALVTGACGACAGSPGLFPPNSCNVFCQPAFLNSTFGNNLIPGPPVF
jgi:parallel beta-helix repeat protein